MTLTLATVLKARQGSGVDSDSQSWIFCHRVELPHSNRADDHSTVGSQWCDWHTSKELVTVVLMSSKAGQSPERHDLPWALEWREHNIPRARTDGQPMKLFLNLYNQNNSKVSNEMNWTSYCNQKSQSIVEVPGWNPYLHLDFLAGRSIQILPKEHRHSKTCLKAAVLNLWVVTPLGSHVRSLHYDS